MKNMEEKLEILDVLYNARLENLTECTKDIKDKLNNSSIEELHAILQKTIDNTEKKDKILKELDLIIENYEIKMANYIEKGYKQGFKDAFELFSECKKK